MDKQVEKSVDKCEECLLSNKHWKTKKVPLVSTPFPEIPWSILALNFSGPISQLSEDTKYMMVLIDYFKWVYYDFVREVSTQVAIEFLSKVCALEGKLFELVMDNRYNLCRRKLRFFPKKKKGIKHYTVALHSPRVNGAVDSQQVA